MTPKNSSSKSRGRYSLQRLAAAAVEALATGADIPAIARTYGLTATTLDGYRTRLLQVLEWVLGGSAGDGPAHVVMAAELLEVQQRLAILRGIESARVHEFELLPHDVRRFANELSPMPVPLALVQEELDNLGHNHQVAPPKAVQPAPAPTAPPPRPPRGPKPKVDDAALIQAISDLNLDLRGRHPGARAVHRMLRGRNIIASIPRIQSAMQTLRSRLPHRKPSRRQSSK